MHTEVRWLSRGSSLQRLVELYDSTVEHSMSIDPLIYEELIKCKNHLFYLADIFSKFNEIQNKIQGKDITIIQVRTVILGFQAKINIYKLALARRDFKYFTNVMQLEGDTISNDQVEAYVSHLEKLGEDFKIRFKDMEEMRVPEWIITPFDTNIENGIAPDLCDELIEMSVDIEAKTLFKNKSMVDYWTNINITNKYHKLCAAAEPFLLAFPSTYLVEAGFSHINSILTKQRNQLNIEERGDLRLKLTNLQPNINEFIKNHQPHPSH